MKIISRGTPPDAQPLRAECAACRTVVEFVPSEATYCADQREGDYWLLKCPVCARSITKAVKS